MKTKNKNPHLLIRKTSDKILFRNLKDGSQWSFTKLHNQASNASLQGHQVSFGFPKVSQVIYPNQTARLNSGWRLDELPQNTMMHTFPGNGLI